MSWKLSANGHAPSTPPLLWPHTWTVMSGALSPRCIPSSPSLIPQLPVPYPTPPRVHPHARPTPWCYSFQLRVAASRTHRHFPDSTVLFVLTHEQPTPSQVSQYPVLLRMHLVEDMWYSCCTRYKVLPLLLVPVAYIIESHVPTFHCSVGFFTFTVFLMLPLSGLPASHVAHAKPFPDWAAAAPCINEPPFPECNVLVFLQKIPFPLISSACVRKPCHPHPVLPVFLCKCSVHCVQECCPIFPKTISVRMVSILMCNESSPFYCSHWYQRCMYMMHNIVP